MLLQGNGANASRAFGSLPDLIFSSHSFGVAFLDQSLNLIPAAPSDLHISITNADKDSMTYTLLKVVWPTTAASMEGEHWIYYFYATPGRHFSRKARVTLRSQTIQKTFLLESYHHIHLLS